MKRQPEVISHWHKVYENFAISPQAFYDLVEQAITDWKIPDVECSRVTWKEGGILTANRVYLRVSRGPANFDICAAPYGTGFFFSYWVTSPSKRLKAILYFILVCFLMLFTTGFGLAATDGEDVGGFLGIFVGLVMIVGLAFAVRAGKLGDEEAVFAMPILGRLYGRIFQPVTWFAIDTMTMHQESVAHALFQVIDTVTKARGIRELSEAERRSMAVPGAPRQKDVPLLSILTGA